MQLAIGVDPRAGMSLQRQVVEQIRGLILDGRLAPGTRMPASRVLADDLGVSRNTVLGAFSRLVAEGLLETREPVGTFVAPHPWLEVGLSAGSRPEPDSALDRCRSARLTRRLKVRTPPHRVQAPCGDALKFDFWVGTPDPALFPLRSWRSLLSRMLQASSRRLSEYGDPQGLLSLRTAIAEHLGATRAIATDASRIVVTNGIQEGLNLVARLLVDSDVEVAVENPCYRGASQVFAQHGAELHPVTVDRSGLDPAGLPATAALAYVTPSHQYPLGASLTLARRQALLEWAESCQSYVVEDDYDSDFHYDGSPLPALKSLDRNDQVIYLGTFSKSLGAGLRIGYMVLPAELCGPVRDAKALLNNCQPWLEQAALAAFLAEGGYAECLRRQRQAYAARRNHLCAALGHLLPSWQIEGSGGGMHVVVYLPQDGPDAETVEAIAQANAIGVYSIDSGNARLFGCEADDPLRRVLLFGYASLTETDISAALLRLRQIV